jgi:hypothetical protein
MLTQKRHQLSPVVVALLQAKLVENGSGTA